MSLCLMRADGSGYLEVSLDPITNKSGDVWHVQLSGLKVGVINQLQSITLYNLASEEPKKGATSKPPSVIPDRQAQTHKLKVGFRAQNCASAIKHSCIWQRTSRSSVRKSQGMQRAWT
jgi:hypothetical protein